MVDTNSIISSVVATCGRTYGFSGDGGPAAWATLNNPSALAINPGGILSIVDSNNNRVRSTYLPAGRAGVCPSADAGAPPPRDTAQSTLVPPPGLRTPLFDERMPAQSTTDPTTPVVVGPPHFAWALAPAAAPAAATLAPAARIGPAPAVERPVAAPIIESAPAISARQEVVTAASRNPTTRTAGDSGPGYWPAVLIPLAMISLVLLGIRRRKNRRQEQDFDGR
jgi:hypothetical protein